MLFKLSASFTILSALIVFFAYLIFKHEVEVNRQLSKQLEACKLESLKLEQLVRQYENDLKACQNSISTILITGSAEYFKNSNKTAKNVLPWFVHEFNWQVKKLDNCTISSCSQLRFTDHKNGSH